MGKTSNDRDLEKFWEEFVRHVNRMIGGVEKADEFFRRNPKIKQKMRPSARYHFKKNPLHVKSCAGVFFQHDIEPLLNARWN
jgi:hypothetical protein